KVSKGSFFVQFIIPNSDFELDKKYYQSYLDIINAFSSDNLLMKDVDISNEKQVTRENYGLLRQCTDSSCFCLAESGAAEFNLDNYKELLCLSTVFSYDVARIEFKTKFNELKTESLNDYEVLNQTLFFVLDSLALDASSSATKIKNCYNLVNNTNFLFSNYEAFSLIHFNTSSVISYDYYEILKNFYELTDGGIIFKIKTCSTIPNKNSCVYTKDVKGNFILVNTSSYSSQDLPAGPLTSSSAKTDSFGPLFFYYPRNQLVNIFAKVLSFENIVEITLNSPGYCFGDEDFNCVYGTGRTYFCNNNICDSTTLCETAVSAHGGMMCKNKSGNKCSSIKTQAECESNSCAGCRWIE
ncbi:MAG: hypothetical protein PHN56_06270, partial [Candidatus Nanoarchaeia archaeon]|nr:hypothetical protein [Candidatus Nanoarchaeia archaeon]